MCHALASGFAGISSLISSEYWSCNLQFRLAPREANIQDVVGCEMADLVAHEADLSDARLTMTVKQSENVALTICRWNFNYLMLRRRRRFPEWRG